MTPEIYQQVMDFGITSCDEYVVPNPDGSYTIMLNARSATNRLEEAFKHAVEHIMEGDLDQEELDVNQIEAIRHGIAVTESEPESVIDIPDTPDAPVVIDWKKLEKRIQKAKAKLALLSRYNIDNYVQDRLARGDDLFSSLEERWLEE